MSKVFLDTNILAYACDHDTPAKRDAARGILKQAASGIAPCVSTQVLQEFYVVATGKLSIAPLQAKDIIRSFRRFEVVTIDADDIERAVDGNILWQVSFWDALIIVAAQKAKCEVLYSEDLNTGQAFDSLRVVNPFTGLAKRRGRGR